MKKIFSIILVISLIYTFVFPVSAQETQSNIECSYTIDGYIVHISGRVLNSTASKMVSIIVGESENYIYIDQTNSSSNGKFEFKFIIPEEVPDGNYTFRINTEGSSTPYVGVLEYIYIERVTSQIMNGDIDVNIKAYVPTIQGTVSCTEGKSINIKIVNTTDNTVIEDDTLTASDGVCNLNYTLPSLIYGKKYSVIVSCNEKNSTLVYVNATIDSAVLVVKVTGEVQVADNIRIDARLWSIEYIDLIKTRTITASETLETTVPNVISYMSCNLSMQCYQTLEFTREPSSPDESQSTQIESVFDVIGETNSPSYVVVNIADLPFLNEHIFTVEYEPAKIELVDACAFTQEKETTTGLIQGTNIEILTAESGKIAFRINEELPSDKVTSGVVNLLKFKKLVSENVSITSKLERNIESIE